MNFKRKQQIETSLSPKRALIIYGPRRIGKTTLLKAFLDQQKKNTDKRLAYFVGDDLKIRELFSSQIQKDILDFSMPYDLIAIDEAQQIPNIGLGTKMIIDAYPEKEIILTGSSSFNLSNKIGEPLTGRHFTLTLLPLTQNEMIASRFELKNFLEDFLIYGAYPEVLQVTDSTQKEKILNELVSSYLYKDVLALDKIKSPDLLRDIARMIAFQVGQEVSLNEIAVSLRTDVKTVSRYLDLLEKMFVIKKVRGFSRNLRNEITKKSKYYFIDLGVRNAVIGQFSKLNLRNDIGALWENFVFMELYKQSVINNQVDNYYFWRTHTGVEIDIIKESQGKLMAIECKWSINKKVKIPKLWTKTYPDSTFQTINSANYLDNFLKE
ncbi:MAG TPA: ATP-binding protein [Candidatus Moranbacteria bacterium]|nr:ATP-binding protein [Candidatus Moranbacteria bacterium]